MEQRLVLAHVWLWVAIPFWTVECFKKCFKKQLSLSLVSALDKQVNSCPCKPFLTAGSFPDQPFRQRTLLWQGRGGNHPCSCGCLTLTMLRSLVNGQHFEIIIGDLAVDWSPLHWQCWRGGHLACWQTSAWSQSSVWLPFNKEVTVF